MEELTSRGTPTPPLSPTKSEQAASSPILYKDEINADEDLCKADTASELEENADIVEDQEEGVSDMPVNQKKVSSVQKLRQISGKAEDEDEPLIPSQSSLVPIEICVTEHETEPESESKVTEENVSIIDDTKTESKEVTAQVESKKLVEVKKDPERSNLNPQKAGV